MARPKREEGKPSAHERLVESFWLILDQDGYKAITIARLCKEAQVNHNTFYYHFDNIDELSSFALEESIGESESEGIFALLNAQGIDFNQIVEAQAKQGSSKRLHRVLLCLASGPAHLQEQAVFCIVNHWLASAGKTLEDLDDEERIELRYLIGGLIFALQDESLKGKPEDLVPILNRHLAPIIYQTMVDLLLSEPIKHD